MAATQQPDPYVEVRFKVPRAVVDVLDAVSGHRRIERFELMNEVLQLYADDRMREATALLRVM